MELTGKAKEDFINYLWNSKFKKEDYKEYEDYIENQKESHTYADIIEWLDSLDVYVEIGLDKTTYPKYWVEISKYTHFGNYKEIFNDGLYKDRETATQQAIIKANEIYNEQHI